LTERENEKRDVRINERKKKKKKYRQVKKRLGYCGDNIMNSKENVAVP
jgi:hypothetical protein